MVKRQSEQAQFVVVSLRRPMIENADHAVGVSLRADGYSSTVGIREVVIPDEEEHQANQAKKHAQAALPAFVNPSVPPVTATA
jgi:hypothetical protein